VSRVNLKLEFGEDDYLPGICDVRRFQDKNLRETFVEQLNTELESSKFCNLEDVWNNLRKIVCEVADCALGKKVRNTARNISETALC